MQGRTDTELLLLLREGDVQAFKELYDTHWDKLFAIAIQKLTKDDACDVLQDLFLEIWKKRSGIYISSSLEAYLFVALQNRIFNFYKKRLAEKQKHLTIAAKTNLVADPDPEVILQAKEVHGMVQDEIQAMPDKMRNVFELSRYKSLSSQAIASHLSISDQTVRNQISAALKRLRHRLQMHL